MGNKSFSSFQTGGNSIPLLKKIKQNDDPSKPLLSVIVTSFAGNSYDNLFRQVPQVAPGGRVSLYSLNMQKINDFFNEIMNVESSKIDEIKNLSKEMKELSPDAVLFNFECCSGCASNNNYHFPQKEPTIKLFNYLLERGHMVMCSDFAVKALINDWSKLLGPNPFLKLGECSTFLELSFLPKTLEESPSKQLQMVGQLCQTGQTSINAPGGTIVFGVDKKEADNQIYTLSVLTIVTKTCGFDVNSKKEYAWDIENKTGAVGHALLKYKTGGILLLSAGHWISLSNLSVNIDNLEGVAMRNYGENNEYLKEIDEIKKTENEGEKKEKMNKMANRFVQQTAACNYSSNFFSKNKK